MTPPTATQVRAAAHETRTRRPTPARPSRTAARSAHHDRSLRAPVREQPRRPVPDTPRRVTRAPAGFGPNAEHREHAEFRALRSVSGIGAAVIGCRPDWVAGENRWTALVTDGDRHRYVEVRSHTVKPGRSFPPTTIEEGIEQFAEGLPETHRLYHLINACPLHLAADGTVFD